jgi:hypothetical protein
MKTKLLEKLLEAAAAHGKRSEPDHEVGDLQDILRSCWQLLTSEQQRKAYEKHEEIVTEWLAG